MIIKALTIENFKGISKPVRVEFKPITLLFGPNSAGKSTIVQALHYVREILERNNVDADRTAGADESFDLGGFRNLVHKHNLDLPIRFKFELSFHPLTDESNYLIAKVDNAWIELEIKWSNFLTAPLVFATQVGLDGELFGKIVCDEAGNNVRIVDINFNHHLMGTSEVELEGKNVKFPHLLTAILTFIKKDFIVADNKIGLFLDHKTALPRPIRLNSEVVNDDALSEEYKSRVEGESYYHWSEPSTLDKLNDFFETYFGEIAAILRKELRQFRYIGPIRKTPPRFFTPVRTDDETRWTSGLAAWDLLNKADDDFVQRANAWLADESKLNSGYRLDVKRFKEVAVNGPIYLGIKESRYVDNDAYEELIREELEKLPVKARVLLREEATGLEVLPQDVGIGISQALPVIVVALHSKNGIVAIEQPELHIHPAFQVALGDLFISQIKEKDVCFLLETHSEHLLLRLMRRIRETSDGELPPDTHDLKPDELAIHYVEQLDSGMQITSIRVDKEGDFIDKWPCGFFPERFEELY